MASEAVYSAHSYIFEIGERSSIRFEMQATRAEAIEAKLQHRFLARKNQLWSMVDTEW